ncbi:M12 family metallopeptidase [Methylobacterium sp. EM32]|uniref:M12 family metallopeptidase n=1 Tax=Methylobacterium sp. EM32 TaxID=3163481 RepID=UPI00339ED91B
MSGHKKELQRALAKIARIAREAAEGMVEDNGDPQTEAGPFHDDEDGPGIGCSLRQLPEHALLRAARTAIQINPANGLNMAAMSSLGLDPGVLDPQNIAVLTSKYWGPKPRQLTVGFMDGASGELRQKIVSNLNAWNRCGGISFVETQGVGQVRISREGAGYWSYLGTDILHIPTDRPTMNLQGFTVNTPDSEYRRVVRHEAGHTLGFPHEHMRKQLIARIDRQKAYDYFWQTQRWNRAMVDAQVLTPLGDSTIMGTPSDEDSIMCYQLPGSITTNGIPIRGGRDINRTDCAFCARIYPKTGSSAGAMPDDSDSPPDAPRGMRTGITGIAAYDLGHWGRDEAVEPDPSQF